MTKPLNEYARKYKTISRQIVDDSKTYTQAMESFLGVPRTVAYKLNKDLEPIQKTMKGIAEDGSKLSIVMNAKGITGGTRVDTSGLENQKRIKQEIEALNKQELRYMREMWDIQFKLDTAKPGTDTSKLQEVLRILQEEIKLLQEKRDLLAGDFDNSKHEQRLALDKKSYELKNLEKKAIIEQRNEQDRLNESQRNSSKIADQITKTLTTMVTIYATKWLRDFWRDSIQYAQEYYDLLNEIRIVTGMYEREANALGQNYMRMAEQMKTTSTEVVKAAVEFARQGLPQEEVEKRMRATIQYGKISSLAFTQSAELVTAAVNTMGIDAQRVVDIWAVLGDMSASGADEIGKAMQRSSASAVEFGYTMETLGSQIAAISEKTRLAPEVIGTSINSIMSRLHSIKATGFSEDDPTSFNDIAKALATINVQIMDQYENWRPMPDILDDVAAAWGG